MKKKLVINDVRKNFFVAVIPTVFMAAAILLIALGSLLTVRLLRSIDGLMEQAMTPHFLQMHSGPIEEERLQKFSVSHPSVSEYQILEFLNLENGSIELDGISLRDSTQDNGVSVQSPHFDFLVDAEGRRVEPKVGELYIPVAYQREYDLSAGGSAMIAGHPFRIAGFFRDSQMNSMMASSKRLLVHPSDYDQLKEFGEVEYLIEFRLRDMAETDAFVQAYGEEKLPSNGPAITYSLIRLMNILSDGMVIGVIVGIGLLVILMALLCVRFTLLAKLEEEAREIGVLKALGTPVSELYQLYFGKYLLLSLVGSMLGIFGAYWLKEPMLKDIRRAFGESGSAPADLGFVLLSVGVVLAVLLFFVTRTLKRVRHISAVEALQNREMSNSSRRIGSFQLSRHPNLPISWSMGIQDLLSRRSLYATVFVVFLFSVLLIVIPRKLVHTMSSDQFATYMGIGKSDLRFDIPQSSDLEKNAVQILDDLKSDPRIARTTIFFTKSFRMRVKDGTWSRRNIELGDHQQFAIHYSQGRAPLEEDEIALSSLLAKDMGMKLGDPLEIETTKGRHALRLCGIYSDITNGGKSAKAVFEAEGAPTIWAILYADARDGVDISELTSFYQKKFEAVKVTALKHFMDGIYGPTLRSITRASKLSLLIALLITGLMTVLFVRLLIAKDHYRVAVLKSCGFTVRDIRKQYGIGIGIVTVFSILAGILLADWVGEKTAGLFLSWMGADSFRFVERSWLIQLAEPAILFFPLLLGMLMGTKSVKKISISECVTE